MPTGSGTPATRMPGAAQRRGPPHRWRSPSRERHGRIALTWTQVSAATVGTQRVGSTRPVPMAPLPGDAHGGDEWSAPPWPASAQRRVRGVGSHPAMLQRSRGGREHRRQQAMGATRTPNRVRVKGQAEVAGGPIATVVSAAESLDSAARAPVGSGAGRRSTCRWRLPTTVVPTMPRVSGQQVRNRQVWRQQALTQRVPTLRVVAECVWREPVARSGSIRGPHPRASSPKPDPSRSIDRRVARSGDSSAR